jgi:hypothetical protein
VKPGSLQSKLPTQYTIGVSSGWNVESGADSDDVTRRNAESGAASDDGTTRAEARKTETVENS